jgi:malonate-semialdehyde dehydrogenase (acetylating)/methylmalonate-semialdehyde dehydrogenase
MAISVVIAVEPVADELIEKIVERMGKLRTGDGRRGCDMGPLVTKEHRDKVAGYIAEAEKDGARIIVDGRIGKYTGTFDGAEEGFWLAPTLMDNVPLTSKAYTEEIFGPVLNIVRVKSYDEGVELINSGQYGNGTAIFTNDGGAARRFQYEIEAGMVGINVPVPVPVAYYSFGGWKDSMFGDTKAHGVEGVKFFTREKTMTSRWLDPSHGGINLGFPQN